MTGIYRFNFLSWKILEAKLAYYCSELVYPKLLAEITMTDIEYDIIEEEYKALAIELNLISSASDMVGFDLEKPSCRLVLRKYGIKHLKK